MPMSTATMYSLYRAGEELNVEMLNIDISGVSISTSSYLISYALPSI